MQNMSSDVKYAYLRVENDSWPSIVMALGCDVNDIPRGLRVKGGKTLAELALLAESKSKSKKAEISREFFGLWKDEVTKALGPLTKLEKLKVALSRATDGLTDEEKAELSALL